MASEDTGEKRGRGRPKKITSKRRQFNMRFTDDENDMLNHLSIETDDNKTDVMRKALKFYYNFRTKGGY